MVDHHDRLAVGAEAHRDVPRLGVGGVLAVERDDDRLRGPRGRPARRPAGSPGTSASTRAAKRVLGTRPLIPRRDLASSPLTPSMRTPSGVFQVHEVVLGLNGASACRPLQPLERREAPDLLAPGRHGVVGDVEGAHRVQVALDLVPLGRVLLQGGADGFGGDGQSSTFYVRAWRRRVGDQPTAPSICSSIRRLSSRAYSIGSSLAIGSTKPRTIIAIASSCSMPRDMR